MTDRRVPSRRQGGFSLVELILVMVVLFTLATVVAPRFSDSFPSLQVRTSTDHLFAWARKARADAALTGTRQRLMLDTANRKYWIEYEARPIRDPGRFVVLGGAWEAEPLPEAVSFASVDGAETDPSTGSLRYIEFRPDGTATKATITISNDSGDKQTLKIEGETSKITIQQASEKDE